MHPTAPANRPPILHAVTIDTPVLHVGDSALIVVNVSDPDRDPLVFDWYADGRFRLKDAPLVVYRFSSPTDSQVGYYEHAVAPVDTARIYCVVRDPLGLTSGGLLTFLLNK